MYQGGSRDAFNLLKEAYSVLSDESQKVVYDEKLPTTSAKRQVPQSQQGIVKGVHVQVHGQTGLVSVSLLVCQQHLSQLSSLIAKHGEPCVRSLESLY